MLEPADFARSLMASATLRSKFVRVGVYDIPALGHGLVRLLLALNPRSASSVRRPIQAQFDQTPERLIHEKEKNAEASVTMISTIKVVIHTSFQVGHVTLLTSCRTSCTNSNGLNFDNQKSFLCATRQADAPKLILWVTRFAEARCPRCSPAAQRGPHPEEEDGSTPKAP